MKRSTPPKIFLTMVAVSTLAVMLPMGANAAGAAHPTVMVSTALPLSAKELRIRGLLPPQNVRSVNGMVPGRTSSDFVTGHFHYHVVSKRESSGGWIVTSFKAQFVNNADSSMISAVPAEQANSDAGISGNIPVTPNMGCAPGGPGECGSLPAPGPSAFPRPTGPGTPGEVWSNYYPNYEGQFNVTIKYTYGPIGGGYYGWQLTYFNVDRICGGAGQPAC